MASAPLRQAQAGRRATAGGRWSHTPAPAQLTARAGEDGGTQPPSLVAVVMD